MLKTVVLSNILMHFIFQDSLINRTLKKTAFIWNTTLLQHFKCLYCHFWSISSIHFFKKTKIFGTIEYLECDISHQTHKIQSLTWPAAVGRGTVRCSTLDWRCPSTVSRSGWCILTSSWWCWSPQTAPQRSAAPGCPEDCTRWSDAPPHRPNNTY